MATKLFERVQKASADCKRQSENDFADLIEANHGACTVLIEVGDRYSLKPCKTDQSIADRLLLESSFFQGIHLTETAIVGGFYSQAGALVRQEMETLAAIENHKKNKWKPGKTPNVKELGWMSVVYDELNNLTHLGLPGVLDPLHRELKIETIPDAQPCSILPIYNKNYAKPLYGQHTIFVVAFAIKNGELLNEMYGESLTKSDCEILRSVVLALQEGGIIAPGNS